MRVGELWGVIPTEMEIKILDNEDKTLFVGKREKSEVLHLWNHSVKDFYKIKEENQTNKLVVKIDGVENDDTDFDHL